MARKRAATKRTTKQHRGVSIHIGLNDISHTHYDWDGRLDPCENDAKAMAQLARAQGFTPTILRTKQATSKKVIAAIAKAADTLTRGDILLLSYSGHGGQVPDHNGEEGDGDDETLCLYDRELIDDELFALWGRFEEGVRILMISDSCHSGTLLKRVARPAKGARPAAAAKAIADGQAKVKALPRPIAWNVYDKHRALYDGIQTANPKGDRAGVAASVLLISACEDGQEALAGYPYSLFTRRLLEVWNSGAFNGGHRSFRMAIANKLPADRHPNYYKVGASNAVFERQRPFTV